MSTVYECIQRMALELEKEDIRAGVEVSIDVRVWERMLSESRQVLKFDVLGGDVVFMYCGNTTVVVKRDPTRKP